MTPEALRQTEAFRALLRVSSHLGDDPLQVQGPGGNTSLKADGVMWVKASGAWLAEAEQREIMTPIDARALKSALIGGEAAAANAANFALPGGAEGLRPSIETAFHAALDWPVVLHTHSVATLAIAIRADAAAVVADRLGDLGAAFVPYVKPGVDLARAIMGAVLPETRVVVLGNHGILVAERSPAAAEALLREASARLDRDVAEVAEADPAFAQSLKGTGWMAVPHGPTQEIARDPALTSLAGGGALYPDHLIFLGPGVIIAKEGETAPAAAARAALTGPPRKLVIAPGRGAAIPVDASPSVLALARALGDVLARAEPEAPILHLSTAEEHDLLNWDAEKHRQALEASRTAAP